MSPDRPDDGPRDPERPGTLGRDPAPGRGPDGLLPPDFRVQAPSVSLPRGGGAISGIGEKFQANPVTGTGSLSIPLPLSAGRGGATPGVGLAYDSGGANGPFGLGWRLSLPSIQRKTSRGLPRYIDDGDHADTFVLSDAEDLVPLLEDNGGTWEIATRPVNDGVEDWTVQRFRPRVEGGFSLIERWRRDSDRYTWWRTISAGNVKRVYGKSENARLTDPEDLTKVFEWLLESEQDERGNLISYQYVEEDAKDRVATYRYPKRISYGNSVMNHNPDDGGTGLFRFHLVFDYGDHDPADPGIAPSQPWPTRADPFSNFRAGFNRRCYRLCQRVLMFHGFTALRSFDGHPVPVVVKELALTHDERPTVTTLTSAQAFGWRWDGVAYETASLPALTLDYIEPIIGQTLEWVEGLDELPHGLDLTQWRLLDLDGEGLQGLLTEQGGGWFYKRNEGGGQFAPARSLGSRPNVAMAGLGVRLVDLDGDGKLELMRLQPGVVGTQRREEAGWGDFRPFQSVPTQPLNGPDARLIDLDGDGHADLLITDGNTFTWYRSEARDGFSGGERRPMAPAEQDGPRFLFSRDGAEFHLADMSGDGLSDIVRIRNGSICYWPNLGYGRFGKQIRMTNAPLFDHPDQFEANRLRLADIDGSGPTDLIYLGREGVQLIFNQSGNSWSAVTLLTRMPPLAQPNDVQVTDLRGDGTACLVWSSPLLREGVRPLRYVRLMADGKPWLLRSAHNGLGRSTVMEYTPSTTYYLEDRRAGTPWATRLPFPVHCLSRVESADEVTGWRFASRYAYHHGYFDGHEREFRGFGMVEQWDAESVGDFDDPSKAHDDLVVDLPLMRSRSWFHTGAWKEKGTLTAAFAAEYTTADPDAHMLSEPTVPDDLVPAELREAHRALKGRLLRQETYSEDLAGNLKILYATASSTYSIVRLQPAEGTRPGSFRVDAAESIEAAYELELASGVADPRVSHSLTLEVDDYGTPRRSVVVSYPRRGAGHDAEQLALTVVVSENEVIHQDDRVESDDIWHLGVPARSKSWELTETDSWTDDAAPTRDSVREAIDAATSWSFEERPTGPGPHVRLLAHQVSRYWNDNLDDVLDPGLVGLRALPYDTHALAFTAPLMTELFGVRVGPSELNECGYVDLNGDGDMWLPSGVIDLDQSGFYQPIVHSDPWGNATTLTWQIPEFLFMETVEDPGQMAMTAEYDLHTLQPFRVTDPNGTESEATFDALGRVLTTSIRNGPNGDSAGAHSSIFSYNNTAIPVSVHTSSRKDHGGSDWQESWAYSDGGGAVVQTKVQAAPDPSGAPRWIGTGRVELDNKGNPVKQYEPFFSTTSDYEDEVELVTSGVTVVLQYDPIGRNIQVTLPDDSIRTWSYGPWSVSAADENDNDASSPHFDTPAVTHLDALGRAYKSIETPDGVAEYETRVALDVLGNALSVTDPRLNVIQIQRYDLLGRPAFVGSADEGYDGMSGDGERYALLDVVGQPIFAWRSGNQSTHQTVDELRRPVGLYVDEGGGERLVEHTFFGDKLGIPLANGLPVQVFDTAGTMALAYDFRGRATAQVRRVFTDIRTEADWTGLEAETTEGGIDTWLTSYGTLSAERFEVESTYDALDRIKTQTAPDRSVSRLTYDTGGSLLKVDVDLHGATSMSLVSEITYNARGQRESITYGNHTSTTYTYDPQRLWLTRILTQRAGSTHATATLQDLGYSRDATGNITSITDAAHETVFFANTQVTPERTFSYDSLYRLTRATGREKTGATMTGASYANYSGGPGGIPDSADPALRTYTQSYRYDAAGNMQEMKHQNGSGGAVLWRRGYHYQAWNNQLLSTSLPGDDPDDPATHSHTYAYNPRGAMVHMPHLNPVSQNLVRDVQDQIRSGELDAAGALAWYAYDAGGERVRKVWDKGSVVEERIYIGPYEVWRKQDAAGNVEEERQTLHVMDDQRRIAMVETLTVTGGAAAGSPTPRFRYQLGDHVGTAGLEVDEDGAVISYEELHPHGTTAWWAESGAIQVSAKRYRYTGKERDEETGLQYHSARYLICWLGRWDRPDPAGAADGPHRFVYTADDPVNHQDPTGLGKVKTAAQITKILVETGLRIGRRSVTHVKRFADEAVSIKKLRDTKGVKVSETLLDSVDSRFPGLEVKYNKAGMVDFQNATQTGTEKIVFGKVDIGEFVEEGKDLSAAWKKLAKEMDLAPAQIKELKKKYTPHHEWTNGEITFVDSEVHAAYRHTGGNSLRKAGFYQQTAETLALALGAALLPTTSEAAETQAGGGELAVAFGVDIVLLVSPLGDVKDAFDLMVYIDENAEAAAAWMLGIRDSTGITLGQALSPDGLEYMFGATQ